MANVITQQHDLNQINVDATGDSIDRAIRSTLGLWDAYEMGISRQEVERRFDEANTPEAREEILVDLRRRAIERAGLATIGGKVAVVTVGNSWHDLGVQVDKAMTWREAWQLASLDYTVEKLPCEVEVDGSHYPVPGVFTMGRKLSEGVFSLFHGVTVGDNFTPVQNDECFEFLDQVIGKIDGAHYLTAGAIEGGKKTFVTARLPAWAEPVLGDEVFSNVVLTNAHDGTEAINVIGCEDRPVCRNTRRLALANAKRRISLTHTQNINDRIADAQQALFGVVKQFDEFSQVAHQMPKVEVNPQKFVDAVMDECPRHSGGLTAADASKGVDWLVDSLGLTTDEDRSVAAKRFERMIARRKMIIDDVMEREASETNRAPGTLWGAYNAVTEHANHGLRYMGSTHKKAETRFGSLMTGRADEINQEAFGHALDMVATA